MPGVGRWLFRQLTAQTNQDGSHHFIPLVRLANGHSLLLASDPHFAPRLQPTGHARLARMERSRSAKQISPKCWQSCKFANKYFCKHTSRGPHSFFVSHCNLRAEVPSSLLRLCTAPYSSLDRATGLEVSILRNNPQAPSHQRSSGCGRTRNI